MLKFSIEITLLGCIVCFCSLVVGALPKIKNVRLFGSSVPLQGRVEVYHRGEWGTVCNNGWSSASKNLDVVCRELGYTKGASVGTSYPGTGRVWLDRVNCSGSEDSITSCPHSSWGDTSCAHSRDVSVKCDICQRPIISGKENLVQDWFFTATSYKESNPPHKARLKSSGSWCLPALVNQAFTHYLQVELPRLYLVSAVATIGGVTVANYVKTYRLMYSDDGVEWYNATVEDGQVIPGNSEAGNEDVQRRNLDNTIRARLMRFIPLTWASVACMRVEVCGYQLPHSPTVLAEVKSSSIVVSWSKPDAGDDTIKKYYGRYWKVKEGKNSQKIFESASTSAVIVSNLSPYTDYKLQVSGVSDLGEGLAKSYSFRTLEAAPSGSPSRITSTLLGSSAMNITWAPPNENQRNGRITGYIICFPQKRNTNENCEDPIILPGTKTWYVLRDVDFTVQHVVQIRARTSIGTGPTGEGITGVLEYTSPDGVASSLVIAITCSALLLSLIAVVVLAAKGIILKKFVHALRKLTSSQMTVSTEGSKDVKEPDPNELVEDIYSTVPDVQAEVVYETFANVRRMSLALTQGQDDFYSNTEGLDTPHPDEYLYESHDQVVYAMRNEPENETVHDTQTEHALPGDNPSQQPEPTKNDSETEVVTNMYNSDLASVGISFPENDLLNEFQEIDGKNDIPFSQPYDQEYNFNDIINYDPRDQNVDVGDFTFPNLGDHVYDFDHSNIYGLYQDMNILGQYPMHVTSDTIHVTEPPVPATTPIHNPVSSNRS